MAVVAVVWIALREGGVSPGVFVHLDSLTANLVDLAVGVCAALALTVAWQLAHRISKTVRALEDMLAEHVGALPRDRLLAVAALSGFAEEIFFRGALMGSVGLLWSSVIFGLCHVGPVREARLWAVYAVFAGLGFGLLVQWRGVLLPAVVAHCVVNGIGLLRLAEKNETREP